MNYMYIVQTKTRDGDVTKQRILSDLPLAKSMYRYDLAKARSEDRVQLIRHEYGEFEDVILEAVVV